VEILILTSVAVASYYLMSVVQTVLHRDFGHRNRIRRVFAAHAIGHHGQYNPNNLKSDEFVDLEGHALNYYGIPIVVFAAIIYLLAGPMVMTAHLIGVFATFRWHLYLHEHYHLNETYLERFGWFRKKRHLHFIHHRDARCNFAVVEFWIDDLMGTRREN
jgi:hypothetical protein